MAQGVAIAREKITEAKRAIESGESYPAVAARLKIRVKTLRNLSYQERWKSPFRRMVENSAEPAGNEGAMEISTRFPTRPDLAAAERAQENMEKWAETMAPHHESLAIAAAQGHDAFRIALESTARTAIAESIASVPMPRTIGEFKAMVEILEKARKMGEKAGGNGNAGRHVTRLARDPIDVDPIPEADGFRI